VSEPQSEDFQDQVYEDSNLFLCKQQDKCSLLFCTYFLSIFRCRIAYYVFNGFAYLIKVD
jgi:hypothetical protein